MIHKRYTLSPERKERAQNVIDQAITEHHITITNTLEFGPRFFVAQCTYRGHPALFKLCLFPRPVDFRTYDQFRNETRFLRFIKKLDKTALSRSIPTLYAAKLEAHPWHVRELVQGSLQNKPRNIIRFKQSFFTYASARWACSFFHRLHAIPNNTVPKSLNRDLHTPHFTNQLWQYLDPHWRHIVKVARIKKLRQRLMEQKGYFALLYNKAPRVLGHQEPYAANIIKRKGQYVLIDWENIDWTNPTRDLTILWMRGYEHPRWQSYLKTNTLNNSAHAHAQALWDLEVLMQSLFNIAGYRYFPNKKDMAGLRNFSIKMVQTLARHDYF